MAKVSKVDLNLVKRTLESMDNNKGTLGLNLLTEAIFMKKTLRKLKKDINDKGVITKMPQGDYEIDRANPSLTQYNSLVKNYNSTIKQIVDLLSDDFGINVPIEDEFDEFNK